MRNIRATRKPNGTATGAQLASLACSVGLVTKNEQGRKVFLSWLAKDPTAAQKALFDRVEANNRVAASGAKATKKVAKDYPSNWLRAAGVRNHPSARRGRITEAGD